MINSETIFALSSGALPAAIAVVRISGPEANPALQALIGGREIAPRLAALATLRDPASGEPIDQGLVLRFPGPASETGEDVVELQVHGSRAVIAKLFDVLGRQSGLRPARPGEFARRAFENGQIDLTAIEGLGDLIAAETEVQRQQAFRQMAGRLARRAGEWRRQLVQALALVDAGLDFSDEGDVPDDGLPEVRRIAEGLAGAIDSVLQQSQRGERIREGVTIAIAGPVNAGKSTLFNWLAGRDAAIVSPHPGTTRDVIEVHLDLAGYPATVLDTAGMRESDDPVEQEGIRRAQARAADADLVLWVEDEAGGGALPKSADLSKTLCVFSKADLVDSASQRSVDARPPAYSISVKTGAGLDDLMKGLTDAVARLVGEGEPALVTRTRHRLALEEARKALGRVVHGRDVAAELVAEDLRLAARALERLLGRVDVEDVLDAIFRDFCIGK